MNCRNCNFTGRVPLTNNDGQIYEYRKCPECTCSVCGGDGYVLGGPELTRRQPCWKCRPDRFDAHVRLFRKLQFYASGAVKPSFVRQEERKRGDFNPFIKFEPRKRGPVYRWVLRLFGVK